MSQPAGKLLVAYYPAGAIHARDYEVSNIPAEQLSHLIYASADIASGTGTCISINPLDDQINFPALQLLKRRNLALRTLISVGGATSTANFSDAVKNATSRHDLAQSCIRFMKVSGFDGIDVDWDFPPPADKPRLTAFLKELRSQLDAQGATDGGRYLLTAAVPARPDRIANVDVGQVHQSLDWINLKAYDFSLASDTSSGVRTHFAAPMTAQLSDPETGTRHASYNVDSAVKGLLLAGVPASKVVVGISFIGQAWKAIRDKNHGMYQPASGPAQGTWQPDGLLDFGDIERNYVGNSPRFWSAEAQSPWLFDPDTGLLISYDDAQSVALKAGYVRDKSLAGVMIWQLTADDDGSTLLNAIAGALNPSPQIAPIPSPSPVLTSSSRSIAKATLVPLNVDVPILGRALLKFGFLRQLSLQPGEVDAVRRNLAAFSDVSSHDDQLSAHSPIWDLLTALEGYPIPSLLPSPGEFATLQTATLQTFGHAVAGLRKQAVGLVGAPSPARGIAGAMGTTVASLASSPSATVGELGTAQHLLNRASVANKGFDLNVNTSPIGMLNLERLEMTPAGIERGALIATIPLAPGEETSVVQKEWSVTTKEFTSIVTDSLETYSETGVTDNTELAQSTTSQISHANQFNITGTVSGGIPLISGSVTSSYGAQDTSSQSATDSRKHAVAVTQKASSRAKQEHKVTISSTTVTGTSEATTRKLVNPSLTDPIRIDYFSMMRKWRVRLYRYGLRLTYDLVIPEPAGALREVFAQLDSLKAKSGQPFVFPIKFGDINNQTYKALANQYGAQVPLMPELSHVQTIGGPIPGLSNNDTDATFHFIQLNVTVPDGYEISGVTTEVFLSNVDNDRGFYVFGSGRAEDLPHGVPTKTVDLSAFNQFMVGLTGLQTITYFVARCGTGAATFTVTSVVTGQALDQWVSAVWTALYNAAQNTYYADQQYLNSQISEIEDRLNNVDTLTLRREENDEIMKGVLRSLLGPGFEFVPKGVVDALTLSGADLAHGVGFTGNGLDPSPWDWSTAKIYEDQVRFINQAIEWENVVSFLYSYFWDVPPAWEFIRQIKHPDASRQAFLRAGAARVVLTVRKGWEVAWVAFAEGGFRGATIDPNHPYLTIAQEIAAYDDRNYPGIPPANPSRTAIRVEDWVFTTSKSQLSASPGPVEIEVDSSLGFIVGAQVVIDSRVDTNEDPGADFGKQEAKRIVAIRDATHITVDSLDHPHGGEAIVFPIVQPGVSGELIAEWNEYTPSSGTDIAVTSNLKTIV